jgi:hypothetical protein
MPIRYLLVLTGCAFLVCACSTGPHVLGDATAPTQHASSDAAWSRLDPDQDGFLTVDELESQHGMALLRDLWQADTDNDRRVSRQEWNLWWPHMTRTSPSPTMQALNGSAATPASP